jgi:raffinose/stachyose/melibiose transport system substrate-binding protein
MFKNVKISVLFLLMGLLLLMGACSNTTPTDKTVITVPDVEIWGAESSALQVMYDLYKEDNPEIELKEVTVSDMATSLAAGEAPDLMLMDPFLAKESYKQNYIEPLNAYYEEYGYGEKMFDWAKNAYMVDGNVVGIPWNYEGLLLYYNKSLFEENGWDVPTNYNEIMALIPKIEDKGLMPFAWGTSDCEGCDEWWLTTITNSVLGPEGTKQLFSGDKKWTDPELEDAFTRFSDFWNEGYLSDKKSHAISQEDSMQLFATEQAAMRLDGTWSLSADIDTEFEIGFAPFPSWKPDGSPVIPLGVGGGLVINAKSEHKDEVAELLSYFFKPEVVEKMASNGVPEPIEADYSQMEIDKEIANVLTLINDAAGSGETGYVGWTYASPSVDGDDLSSVYLKKNTVEEWLDSQQKGKEKDIKDNLIYNLENY